MNECVCVCVCARFFTQLNFFEEKERAKKKKLKARKKVEYLYIPVVPVLDHLIFVANFSINFMF